MQTELRTVECCSGLVSFRIPKHWVEEYDTEGGGKFFDPGDRSVELALETSALESDEDLCDDDAEGLLAGIDRFWQGDLVERADAHAVIRVPPRQLEFEGKTHRQEDRGILRVVPPRRVRLVTLTALYTGPSEQEDAVRPILELVLREAEACQISGAPST